MKLIRWCVAELWPFEVLHTLAGEWTPDTGYRMWFYIPSNAAMQCIGQTIISMTIFIVYSAVIVAEPLQEFTRFMRWIQKRRQVAADLWTKPTDLSRRQPVNRIHHRHLLSLLSPKADTHFTIPRRVEGWVDLGGCYIPRRFTRP